MIIWTYSSWYNRLVPQRGDLTLATPRGVTWGNVAFGAPHTRGGVYTLRVLSSDAARASGCATWSVGAFPTVAQRGGSVMLTVIRGVQVVCMRLYEGTSVRVRLYVCL